VRALLTHLPYPGTLSWIGLRRERRGPVDGVASTDALVGLGLRGDRRVDGRAPQPAAKRQVTLIQAEHLPVIAALLRRDGVEPALLRRNLVVEGINLLALKDQRFRIGAALFEGTGPCHPCSRMEEALGDGGLAAMRGHGGITARVLEEGRIAVGDAVEALPPDPVPPG
jgi:MOSC domain-containing protein YiiM